MKKNLLSLILASFLFIGCSPETHPAEEISTLSETKPAPLALYGLQLDLPAGWSIEEINRRAEPAGPADPKYGHDCADYIIQNQARNALMLIQPECGFLDGGSDVWPEDGVQLVGENAKSIVRFLDSESGMYKYTQGWITQLTEGNNVQEMRTVSSPPILSIQDGDAITFLQVGFQTSLTGDELQAVLLQADQIILSIHP
jgi:hypothetical protein